MASSDSSLELEPEEPVPSGSALRARAGRRATDTLDAWRSDGAARWLFIWPAVLLILVLSIFPLVLSVALSLSKLAFHQGGVDLKLIGFANYQQLLFGLERSHFIGVLKTPSPLGWAIVIVAIALSATVAMTIAQPSGEGDFRTPRKCDRSRPNRSCW